MREKSIAVFHRVSVAEGKIHGMSPERVHFHEVGAVDSIVDIVGTCVALELLGKPRVLASPVVEGVGWINCAHGRFPIPAPATLAILGARGISGHGTDDFLSVYDPRCAGSTATRPSTRSRQRGLIAEDKCFGGRGRPRFSSVPPPACACSVLGRWH